MNVCVIHGPTRGDIVQIRSTFLSMKDMLASSPPAFREVRSSLRQRELVDGLATEAECAALLRLAVEAAVPGDGYGGDSHPFDAGERFSGLAPSSAARWAAAQRASERAWAEEAAR